MVGGATGAGPVLGLPVLIAVLVLGARMKRFRGPDRVAERLEGLQADYRFSGLLAGTIALSSRTGKIHFVFRKNTRSYDIADIRDYNLLWDITTRSSWAGATSHNSNYRIEFFIRDAEFPVFSFPAYTRQNGEMIMELLNVITHPFDEGYFPSGRSLRLSFSYFWRASYFDLPAGRGEVVGRSRRTSSTSRARRDNLSSSLSGSVSGRSPFLSASWLPGA